MRKIVLMMSVSADGFIAVFLRHALVDELRLYVHPVVIGRGKPLFHPGDTRIDLQLAETRTFGNGVVLLRYGVAT
jgi:riboflavin biosynthesis pyrimidine reductase